MTPDQDNPEATVEEIVRLLRVHILTPEQMSAHSGWWDRCGEIRDILRAVLNELDVDGLGGCRLCCS